MSVIRHGDVIEALERQRSIEHCIVHEVNYKYKRTLGREGIKFEEDGGCVWGRLHMEI